MHWSGALGVIDFSTLVMILAAGIELGSEGAFGFSLFDWVFGAHKLLAYDFIGLAALWQLVRQRFI